MKKTCTKCLDEKCLTDFSKQAKGKYGVTSVCKSCTSKRGIAWHLKNRERSLGSKRAYREMNADAIAIRSRIWREKNADRVKEVSANWARQNAGKKNSYTAGRRAAKKQRTPSWANTDDIKSFYKLAKELSATTGVKANVDHIVPLQSPLVCGLHWAGNLTIVTESLNKRKGNKFWPDMPGDYKWSSVWGWSE